MSPPLRHPLLVHKPWGEDMIVTKTEDAFRLFMQHDHAKVSGEFARHWSSDLFPFENLRDEVEFAITQHDRAWIPLDQQPTWNDDAGEPHSFMNYPLKRKVQHYEQGIEEVRQESLYAGLLCGAHYLSFFDQSSSNPIIQQFISREISNQEESKHVLGTKYNEDAFDFHFRLLQFCDDLSLYFCLNEPGIDKKDENKMFRNGFRQRFAGLDERIVASWKHPDEIQLSPFPFENHFDINIPYRLVYQKEIDDKGLEKAYQESGTEIRSVRMTAKN